MLRVRYGTRTFTESNICANLVRFSQSILAGIARRGLRVYDRNKHAKCMELTAKSFTFVITLYTVFQMCTLCSRRNSNPFKYNLTQHKHIYHFNQTNYYLFSVNCKIHNLVSEMCKLKNLNLKTSVRICERPLVTERVARGAS